ncbi:HAD-IA family hydrolase [Actinocatenispora rupis]|uniref:HAD-IA family hydrolase n=1 Tax=Actinocatenispora rupis TaxID=519421 RepID=UPI0023B27EC3
MVRPAPPPLPPRPPHPPLVRQRRHRCPQARPPRVRRAVEGLGVPASRVLFVDDRGPNLAAAREAGMRTILFTSEDTDRHPVPAGIPRVGTMAGLVTARGV